MTRHSTWDAADDAAARRAVAGMLVEVRPGRQLDVAVHPAPPGGTTVFFTHGGGGNKGQWRYLFREAVARGHGAVAWDWLGHGASPDADDPAAYAGTENLADLEALLARHGSARNLLVGHSMGGRLTLALLAHQAAGAHAVAGAILVASAAPGAIETSTSRGTAFVGRASPAMLRLLRPVIRRAFRRRAWHHDTPAALIEAERLETRRNRMETIKTIIAHPPPLRGRDLAAIDVPVLVVAGARDRIIPVAVSRRLADTLPRSRLVVVPDAAHQVMVEQPGRLAKVVFGFAAELGTPAAAPP